MENNNVINNVINAVINNVIKFYTLAHKKPDNRNTNFYKTRKFKYEAGSVSNGLRILYLLKKELYIEFVFYCFIWNYIVICRRIYVMCKTSSGQLTNKSNK